MCVWAVVVLEWRGERKKMNMKKSTRKNTADVWSFWLPSLCVLNNITCCCFSSFRKRETVKCICIYGKQYTNISVFRHNNLADGTIEVQKSCFCRKKKLHMKISLFEVFAYKGRMQKKMERKKRRQSERRRERSERKCLLYAIFCSNNILVSANTT